MADVARALSSHWWRAVPLVAAVGALVGLAALHYTRSGYTTLHHTTLHRRGDSGRLPAWRSDLIWPQQGGVYTASEASDIATHSKQSDR